jgi:hypothetical protein
LICKKIIVTKLKEAENCNKLAQFSRGGYSTNCAALPMRNMFLSKLIMDSEIAFNSPACKAYKIKKNRNYPCS